MRRPRILALLLVTICASAPLHAEESKLAIAKRAVTAEAKRYLRDAKSMTRWDERQWRRFGEGVAGVAAVYALDKPLYDAVQRNRSSFTDDVSKVVTPFGGRRAENISALLIVAGAWSHNDNLRDAGRDSLGRARPIQEEGNTSFHPFSSTHQSFPSGHSTNAFAFATAIAGHYDTWVVPTIVYSIATGVAMSRVNDRAHFPSDVLAGALIGRGIAKALVHRHQSRNATWVITPAMFDGKPGMLIHVTTR